MLSIAVAPSCLLVYDAGCGACAMFKGAVGFLDLGHRIEFASLSDAEVGGLLEGIPASRRWASFHMLLPDGRIESGAAALPRLVSLLPSGRILSRVVEGRGGARAAGWLYSMLSRLHGSTSCRATDRRAP